MKRDTENLSAGMATVAKNDLELLEGPTRTERGCSFWPSRHVIYYVYGRETRAINADAGR